MSRYIRLFDDKVEISFCEGVYFLAFYAESNGAAFFAARQSEMLNFFWLGSMMLFSSISGNSSFSILLVFDPARCGVECPGGVVKFFLA